MQILEGYVEFESFCLHCAGFHQPPRKTSLLSSVALLAIIFSLRRRVAINLACENIRFSSLFVAVDVSARNVLSDEERGETDVFAGYYQLISAILRELRMKGFKQYFPIAR